MTVQTLKLGREKFVVLKEKDYRQLKAKAAGKPARKRKLTFQERQDAGDVAEAIRRMNDPNEIPIPNEQVRKELGLA
jgi:hypothetical protein